MRCVVATYIFMQHNCRDIRIPHLLGFRFPDSSAYMSCGSMLSNSFSLYMGSQQRMNNFLRGLAQVVLCLARLPQPRIGSYIFHNNGTITLTNRPLTMTIALLERDGASRAIEENTTYTSVEPYVTDMLTYHDNRFREQPNAVNDEYDGVNQMTTSILMRAVAHQYLDRDFREGPFILQLTDMNQSNFLVDDDWNVKALIDLEWICSLPVQMQGAPHWLTELEGVDEIEGDELEKYEYVHQRFLSILKEEEASLPADFLDGLSLADLTKKGWQKGTYWYFQCLESVNAMYTLFPIHIRSRHRGEQITKATGQAMSKYWSQDAGKTLIEKVAQKKHYDTDLRTVFVHDA
ncbi:hypothetical protein CC80DRAFT_557943 [Byssothecium circinans]|uniref:Aminoglycoside phosphotransferase domain-containing protein n=1 Tax=Byssothecium circinans TaxID=147558 RepID=A0A6A5U3P6_9PLEO|nr:hypothetical protein CC80DRAFT_557943 [Byssothecium circinans]